MNKIYSKITAILFGISIVLIVGEVICRVYDDVNPWYVRLPEEQQQNSWKSGIRRNSFGLRDRDYVDIKPSNTKRILILGDSFTHGDGVLQDDRAIFPEILEQQLNLESSSYRGGEN